MNKRIRIKDIARIAGVSKGTVDRVLHNRGNVSVSARKKVIAAMEKLEYEPNVIASALASKKSWRIAVLIPDPKSDPFWEQPREGIMRAHKTLRDYGVEIDFYPFRDADPAHFRLQGNKMLSRHYDALLIAPSFARESHELLDQCEQRNLEYVEINTYLERDHPAFLAYIGQDSYASGQVAAKLLNFEMCSGDTAIILHLEEAVYNARHLMDKQAGFETYFEKQAHKHIRVMQQSFGQIHDGAATDAFIRKMLHTYPGTTGIFVSTSKLYHVVPPIRKYQSKPIRLIGFDLIKPNLRLLVAGEISFLINQNPYKQGFLGIMNLFNHLVLKKDNQKLQFLPLDVVMRENVRYYVEEEYEKMHIVI